MAVIDTASELAEIRGLVSTSLTAEELPDEVIQRDVYLGLAEMTILDRLNKSEAQFKAQTEDTQRPGKIAMKYETAINLIPSVDTLVGQTTFDRIIRLEEKDWTLKISEYNAIINFNVPPSSDAPTAAGVVGINVRQTTSRLD